MASIFLFSAAYLIAASSVNAQQFDFPAAAVEDSAQLSTAMPQLARQVMAVYREDDRPKHLDNLFRLQLVAGQYAEADKTIATLRALTDTAGSPQARAANAQYQVYARAMSDRRSPFDEHVRRAFHGVIRPLDDQSSVLVIRALAIRLPPLQQSLKRALQAQKEKSSISLPDALRLIKAYQVDLAYRTLTPLVEPLIAEEDRRRYIIERDIPVKTPDGATVCAMVVRQRSATGRLPALLNFTIYANPTTALSEARRSASHGYAGVEGFTRGKGCSPDAPVPYEHDGSDAAALIDWISRQPWSDGRVGMYGGSYEGFTQWAAAKHMPKALKTIIPAVPVAPGIDVPMDGNVFLNFVYPWPFYTTNVKTLDDATYFDNARWNRLNHDWYASGRAYRSLDQIDGTPNPIFNRWISHPAYDVYWQRMIPYQQEFARIDIPVLATAGYYYGGPGAAIYYLTQHYKYRPNAEHYLVIGPYDHSQGQRGMVSALGDTTYALSGYDLDPVALVDLGVLRYQWFDYVFKGAPKPAMLKNKVNYQVMGANVWKHAPSVAAMANQKLRFHLSAERSGDGYRLSTAKPTNNGPITQTMDLAARTDADRVPPGGGIVDTVIDPWNALVFVSDRLPEATELSGLFSGRLDFTTNKKDFDFNVALYEQTPKGQYVLLSLYWARASHVGDLVHRRLLTPGKRQRLDFTSVRLTSRQLQPGSRLVVVLGPIRQPDLQINYGTGKDVSDETIADGREPLKVQWFGGSSIDVPVRK